MTKVLAILLLLSASSAAASVQSFKSDDGATIHPVRMSEDQPNADINLRRSCGRPVLLFMRIPDGRIMLLGVFQPKSAC